MTTTRPFALRLFVPSGLPERMRIKEKSNWSGIGDVIPRSQLKEFTRHLEQHQERAAKAASADADP